MFSGVDLDKIFKNEFLSLGCKTVKRVHCLSAREWYLCSPFSTELIINTFVCSTYYFKDLKVSFEYH